MCDISIHGVATILIINTLQGLPFERKCLETVKGAPIANLSHALLGFLPSFDPTLVSTSIYRFLVFMNPSSWTPRCSLCDEGRLRTRLTERKESVARNICLSLRLLVSVIGNSTLSISLQARASHSEALDRRARPLVIDRRKEGPGTASFRYTGASFFLTSSPGGLDTQRRGGGRPVFQTDIARRETERCVTKTRA